LAYSSLQTRITEQIQALILRLLLPRRSPDVTFAAKPGNVPEIEALR
jgi:hypothetical protein